MTSFFVPHRISGKLTEHFSEILKTVKILTLLSSQEPSKNVATSYFDPQGIKKTADYVDGFLYGGGEFAAQTSSSGGLKVIVLPKREFATLTQHELKVAAYCRVSTTHEEQQGSLENQIAYYTHYISDKPG